ncbi:MAG: methylenetetrahydrofolate reductase [Buchnera aphidicola (Eriosoma harunire)]
MYINKEKNDLLQYSNFFYNKKINVSFEFFPPKNLDMENKFWNTVNVLSTLKPRFFSITYGANNSTCDQIFNLVSTVYESTKVVVAPHLTCINHTIYELKKIAKRYWTSGIKDIVALRGDSVSNKQYNHIMYAVDLVKLLKEIGDFNISVAAYPEMHPESKNKQDDLLNLKKKIDAGANQAITQFFFNTDTFLRFRDECISNKIHIDIIPGILPISNFNQICKFSKMTNVNIPKWIYDVFRIDNIDSTTSILLGSNIAMNMVESLYKEGVTNFHFYTLNCSYISYAINILLNVNINK